MSVCLYVGHVREPGKTAEPIMMSFGVLTLVGPWNHVLEGVHISGKTQIFVVVLAAPYKSTGSLCSGVRRSRCHLGLTRVGSREELNEYVLDGVKVGRTHCDARGDKITMQIFVKIL